MSILFIVHLLYVYFIYCTGLHGRSELIGSEWTTLLCNLYLYILYNKYLYYYNVDLIGVRSGGYQGDESLDPIWQPINVKM